MFIKFEVARKLDKFFDFLEKDTEKLTPLAKINKLFKLTPFMFEAIRSSSKLMITNARYLSVDTSYNPKNEEDWYNYPQNKDFQPILKDSTWYNKKALLLYIDTNRKGEDLLYNRRNLCSSLKPLIAHELIHNEQYLKRLHLTWKDSISQYLLNYKQTSFERKNQIKAQEFLKSISNPYFSRKDEVTAIAMTTVEAYINDLMAICRDAVIKIRDNSIYNTSVWRKYVRTVLHILVDLKMKDKEIRKMLNISGIALVPLEYKEINNEELKYVLNIL